MDVYKEIGVRIREVRQRHGDSQPDLATRLNVSRATISRYEDGSTKIDLRTLQKIADHYGRSLAYLLGRETEEDRRVAQLRRVAGETERLLQEVREAENTVPVPLIGTLPGRYSDFQDKEEVEKFYPIGTAAMHPEGAYCLQVMDDSMKDQRIVEGNIVFVDETLDPKEADVVIAGKEEEAVIRVLREDDDGLYLEAGNVAFTKVRIEKADIIGVVVENRSMYRGE